MKTLVQLLLGALLAMILVVTCSAQSFSITNLSKRYDFKITTSGPQYGIWMGKTTVTILAKGTKQVLQEITQPHTYIDRKGIEIASVVDKKTGAWSDVYVADFDFDGHEDLAVADGVNGGYGGISYTIYRYEPHRRRFIRNAQLTRLGQGPYMGIPEPDYRRHTLLVSWKSGCCMHFQEVYHVSANHISKIKEINEYTDQPSDPGYDIIETKILIHGKWHTFVKKKRVPTQ